MERLAMQKKNVPEKEVIKLSVIFLVLYILRIKIYFWTPWFQNILNKICLQIDTQNDGIFSYHLQIKRQQLLWGDILEISWKYDPGILLPDINMQWYLIFGPSNKKSHKIISIFFSLWSSGRLQLHWEEYILAHESWYPKGTDT